MSSAAFGRRLRGIVLLAACGLIGVPAASPQAGDQAARPPKKPSLTLKASPMMAFTPAKIRFVAEVKDGPDDYEDLYCPSVEWDWGDDTTSESSVDCEPFQPGKSKITRRFTVEHVFKTAGLHRVRIRLKRKTRVILSTEIQVQITPGLHDPGLLSRRSF